MKQTVKKLSKKTVPKKSNDSYDELKQGMGVVIKRLRMFHLLSQEALAKKCGVSKREIAAVESGERGSLKTLYSVASALDTTLAHVMRLAEPERPYNATSQVLDEIFKTLKDDKEVSA